MKTFSVFFTLIANTCFVLGQSHEVVVSGAIKSNSDKSVLPYVNILVENPKDNSFVTGTISDENGRFELAPIKTGEYVIVFSHVGYNEITTPLTIGRLSDFLNLGTLFLEESTSDLQGVTILGVREEVETALDKKVFRLDDNISQLGGSVLQAMQNLPGITIDQDGKVYLRGSDKVSILIDGKQSAITGIGAQSGLENFSAASVERIEIINNPSSRYDATGNAGIINIVFKKEKEEGWNGNVGMIVGIGNIGEKHANLEGTRDQYHFTPKINPSLSLNYKKDKANFFVQGDLLYHQQMMKNEFIDRIYDNGERIRQQFLENRTQPIYNFKTGIDWHPNESNSITFSGLFNYRAYNDLGDLIYFNSQTGERVRLWLYDELEVNQTLFATITHKYSFKQPGHVLTNSFNYSFRRKDEAFDFENRQVEFFGTDTTMLIADENIFDLTMDYDKPLKSGRLEMGTKQRARIFPNLITFKPGINSILDPALDGTAEYREWLSAFYGNYIYERKHLELEAGLRVEYISVNYLVDPNHAVYESDGFSYFEPFPSLRASYFINDLSNFSLFYNRRVDRPEERNLRVFPTYADPEILMIGNPTLVPQFTQTVEVGYKRSWDSGYLYGAMYYRRTNNVLTRIITDIPGTNRLTSIDQNADKAWNSGVELVFSHKLSKSFTLNLNSNIYQNRIGAFTITNAYPSDITFSQGEQTAFTGNAKMNVVAKLPNNVELQLTGIYLAADIIPQGTISSRFHVDGGITKKIQGGKGEIFLNASDIFNTLSVHYDLRGTDFRFISRDYYESQVFRIGYSYRF
jgi:outer membrane receptor protein involved in Fe transport